MRLRPVLLSALGFVLLLPGQISGTTIVGIWRPKRITIVADSKATIRTPGHPDRWATVCKIGEAHGLVFALSGLAGAEGISVIEEIKKSIVLRDQATGRSLPLMSIVVAGQSAIAKVLIARNVTTDHTVPIELLIAGMMEGQLQMIRVDQFGSEIRGNMQLMNSTRWIKYPENKGYNGSDPSRGVEILGIEETAQRFRKILPAWGMGDDVSAATRLVAIEASDTVASQYVGAPFSTIVIDKKGAKWIDKGACDWTPSKADK